MIKFTHPHVLKLYEFLLLNIKYDILKNVLLNIKYDILKNVLIKHLTVEKKYIVQVNGFFKISFVIKRRRKLTGLDHMTESK